MEGYTLLFLLSTIFNIYSGNYGQMTFDCEQLQGLCLGETYEVACTVKEDILFQKLLMSSSECSDIEIDFGVWQEVNGVECGGSKDGCGRFCGTFQQKSPAMRIDMNFTVQNALNGATVLCYGQSRTKTFKTICPVTLAEPPTTPVRDLTLHKTLPIHFISWSQLEAEKFIYNVTIRSSFGKETEFIVKDKTYTSLPVNVSGPIADYSICVTTVNCAGASKPTCINSTLGDPGLLPTPNVTFVPSNTTVKLFWSESHLPLNICYDIELDYAIISKCVTGNEFTVLTVGKGNRVYNFRVRARVGDLTGEWSEPTCVMVAPPPSIAFIDHSLSTATNITNVTVSVRIDHMSLSKCHIIPVNEILILSDVSSAEYLFKVKETDIVKNVTLSFEGAEKLEKIKLLGSAYNVVGISPVSHYSLTVPPYM